MKEPCFSCNGVFVHNCSSPNVHGIPRDDTKIEFLDKHPLRRLFKARFTDSYIIEMDYSQLEARICADLAKDDNMMAAFERDEDIHAYAASLLFKKNIKDVSKFERSVAKQLGVFSVMFGASPQSNAAKLGISVEDAKTHAKLFFDRFPKINAFINKVHREALEKGRIYSAVGRPRRWVMRPGDRAHAAQVGREAFSHRIASTAADIALLALAKMHERLIADGLLDKEVFFFNSVHDSILLDVRKSYLQYALDVMPAIMTDVPKSLGFKVPFKVDTKFGRSWGDSLSLEEVLS